MRSGRGDEVRRRQVRQEGWGTFILTREVLKLTRKARGADSNPPIFAPPALEHGDLVISQTPNIIFYLSTKLPAVSLDEESKTETEEVSEAERYHRQQVVSTLPHADRHIAACSLTAYIAAADDLGLCQRNARHASPARVVSILRGPEGGGA